MEQRRSIALQVLQPLLMTVDQQVINLPISRPAVLANLTTNLAPSIPNDLLVQGKNLHREDTNSDPAGQRGNTEQVHVRTAAQRTPI